MARIAAGDDRARDTMVLHNMGLVVSVARRFRWSSLTFEDLMQEGMIGLIKAVNKFDVSRGTQFSTHAMWWIRSAISRAICETGHFIYIPANKQQLVQDFLECQVELLESGIIPTARLLAEKMGVTEEKVKTAQAILTMNGTQTSFEAALPGYDGDVTLHDVTPDISLPSPTVMLQAKQELLLVKERVESMFRFIQRTCGERDKNLFLVHYGFDIGLDQRTLEETGNHFGVTRERARQVLVRIWKKSDGFFAQEDFERMLAGIVALEELAGLQVDWNLQRDRDVALAFLAMFQSTAKEALGSDDFVLCACHYGFNHGYWLQSEAETAIKCNVTFNSVRGMIVRLWKKLKPYSQHLTRKKVSRLITAVRVTNQ